MTKNFFGGRVSRVESALNVSSTFPFEELQREASVYRLSPFLISHGNLRNFSNLESLHPSYRSLSGATRTRGDGSLVRHMGRVKEIFY